jgi:hypothetical protein
VTIGALSGATRPRSPAADGPTCWERPFTNADSAVPPPPLILSPQLVLPTPRQREGLLYSRDGRIVHGGLMRLLDPGGDVRVGDRPEAEHRFDWGEGQVTAGDRLSVRTRELGMLIKLPANDTFGQTHLPV